MALLFLVNPGIRTAVFFIISLRLDQGDVRTRATEERVKESLDRRVGSRVLQADGPERECAHS